MESNVEPVSAEPAPAPAGINFVKYTSIENHSIQDAIDTYRIEGHTQLEWVGTEKVHGANFSFLTDGTKLKCAKRNGLIPPGERFFDHDVIVEQHRDKVDKLWKILKLRYPDITSIAVYGEIFGGAYPHPKVAANPNIKLPVQRGVWYSPNIHFYAFDIKLFPKGGFIGYDEACGYFEECGFMYGKAIVRGTFNEVYSFDVESFVTRVPRDLGLPEIPQNYAEGIVLKPVVHARTAKNERVILKKKHSSFREKVEGVAPHTKPKKKNPTKPVEQLPDSVTKLSAEIIRFINVNRLRGLVSKLGRPGTGAKVFNEFVAAFAKDIIDDFRKEHGVEFDTLEKPMQKKITGYMNGVMTRFLRDHWDDAVSGTL